MTALSSPVELSVESASPVMSGTAQEAWLAARESCRIVQLMAAGDPEGPAALYAFLQAGMPLRWGVCIKLQDAADLFHEVYLQVLKDLRAGKVRQPESLLGYAQIIRRRQLASHVNQEVKFRRGRVEDEDGTTVPDGQPSAEQLHWQRQKQQIMRDVLASLSSRNRELLQRFYLQEQQPEQICAELGLTETQFRLGKSRAKQRFAEQVELRLSQQRCRLHRMTAMAS